MNTNCEGTRFEADGKKYYYCFYDGTVLQKEIADNANCPNCQRPVQAADAGKCETHAILHAAVKGCGLLSLERHSTGHLHSLPT